MNPANVLEDISNTLLEIDKIYSNSSCYKQYTAFILDCLNLVSDKFPPEAHTWKKVVEGCLNGSATPEEVENSLKSTVTLGYALGELSTPTLRSAPGAIANLFRYVLHHESSDSRLDNDDLAMALDCFIETYILFFDHKEEVLELLQKNFLAEKI